MSLTFALTLIAIRGFGGYWSLLCEVRNFDLDSDIITNLWCSLVPNFGCLHWFWRCKEIQYPSSPDWGFGGCWTFVTGVGNLNIDLNTATSLWWTLVQKFSGLHWFWWRKEHPYPYLYWIWFLTGVWNIDLDFNMAIDLWYTHVKNCSCLHWFWSCKEHLCPLCPH